jgi:hypothetical protein
MSVSTPHPRDTRDLWLTDNRHARILSAAKHHTASISSAAASPLPTRRIKRGWWLAAIVFGGTCLVALGKLLLNIFFT